MLELHFGKHTFYPCHIDIDNRLLYRSKACRQFIQLRGIEIAQHSRFGVVNHVDGIGGHDYTIPGTGNDCGRAGAHTVNVHGDFASVVLQLVVDGLSGKYIAAWGIDMNGQIFSLTGKQILVKLLWGYFIPPPAHIGNLTIQQEFCRFAFCFVSELPKFLLRHFLHPLPVLCYCQAWLRPTLPDYSLAIPVLLCELVPRQADQDFPQSLCRSFQQLPVHG